jgi:glycosyltransferase involved in cell wall biosynthesis
MPNTDVNEACADFEKSFENSPNRPDRERAIRLMRVLFVSSAYPGDMERSVYGMYLRMRMFLDAVNDLVNELDILFYVDPKDDISEAAASELRKNLFAIWGIRADVFLCRKKTLQGQPSFWNQYMAPCLSFRKQPSYSEIHGPDQLAAFEACLERDPAAVFIHRLYNICPVLATKKTLPPVLLDLDDVEHVKFFRSIGQPPFWYGKLLYYLQLPALILGERRAIRLAAKTFVCSTRDREYLSRVWRLPRVTVVANGIEVPALDDFEGESKALLFIGSYTYEPNIAAAEFLIRNIWPIVKEAVPDSSLVIAGNKPERIPSFTRSDPRLTFSGFVRDLRELYRRTRVVCCPILVGGGTRVKIIEAAAYGKAIISTTVGAEGLDFRNGSEIILSDDPAGFARACVELLNDPSRCRALGRAARAEAARLYDRRQIKDQIKNSILDGFEYRLAVNKNI